MPATVFVAFQLMFAIITVALISGAVADRLKFSAWLVFAGLWATLVYFPVAHWVFAFDGFASEHGGWIANKLHAIDFAGGTAVHINSGVAGLMLAIVLGKRKRLAHDAVPAAQPAVRDARRRVAVVRLVRVQRRFGDQLERRRRFDVHDHHDRDGDRHARAGCSPSASATARPRRWERRRASSPDWSPSPRPARRSTCWAPWRSALVAGVVCALAVGLKFRLGFDDSLDVVGVHLVGGLTGTLLVGLLAAPESPAINGVTGVSKGLFYGGGWSQLERQAVGAFSVLIYSGVVTLILALILKYTIGLRLNPEAEASGIDEAEHAESGYDFAVISGRFGAFLRERRGGHS